MSSDFLHFIARPLFALLLRIALLPFLFSLLPCNECCEGTSSSAVGRTGRGERGDQSRPVQSPTAGRESECVSCRPAFPSPQNRVALPSIPSKVRVFPKHFHQVIHSVFYVFSLNACVQISCCVHSETDVPSSKTTHLSRRR